MLARRLLIAGSGASFTTPAVAAAFSLGVTGFWNDVASPHGAYYNGKTYLAWVDDTGELYAAEYVHSTKTLSTPVDLGSTTSTDGVIHNAPSVLVRSSDRRIIIAASEDKTAATPGYWISTNAEDATAFGSFIPHAASLTNPTYPIIVQLSGGAIYYFIRYYVSGASKFYTGYYKSTDGGSSWSSLQDLLIPDSTQSQYHSIGSDGSRIDIFTTNTDRAASPSSLYHLYLDLSDVAHKSDGTTISAARPFVASEGTLVQNASLGACRADGWAYSSGNPACLVLVNDADGGTNTLARAARWTGSAWQVNAVASAGGVVGGNVYVSSGGMSTPDRLWFPRKVGSYFELFRYDSPDSGTTWNATQITTGSTADNATPGAVMDATSAFEVAWGLGTFTDADTFTFTLQGYG